MGEGCLMIAPIGILTIAAALFCLLLGNGATVRILSVSAVLGSAAALLVGATNIQPGHLVLGFLLVSVLARPRDTAAMLAALSAPRPGFWLAALTVYGVLSAYFAPRLFAGMTNIIPLGSTAFADTGGTQPLGPVSSNLTQSIYLVGGLLCFAMTSAVASTERGFADVTAALFAYCVANLVFALIDLGTAATGTEGLLEFIRNAQYTLHVDDRVGGMKRIVGSFTEASSFARSTLGVLGFTGTLWLCGIRPRWSGLLAAASIAALVLSTSSTGLAGLVVMAAVLTVTALSLFGRLPDNRPAVLLLVLLPVVALALLLFIAIIPSLSSTVADYVDLVVLGKFETSSGIERNSWNVIALQNIFDSFGLGVGLGTIRASSFAMALLASVGVPGALCYLAFLWGCLRSKGGRPGSFASAARLAARNGCLGLLVGDLMVGPVIDQGIFFYMLAALAAAAPLRRPQRRPAFDPPVTLREVTP